MEKSTHKISSNAFCLLDTDVIINWLAKEEDPSIHKDLWKAPHKIMKLIEANKIKGLSTLINLLEIRFVLRRKKEFGEDKIKQDIAKILQLLEIVIPDEINLLKANSLQTDNPLSPFDAILISIALSLDNIVLISRDKQLIQIAGKFVPVFTPEEFLNELKI